MRDKLLFAALFAVGVAILGGRVYGEFSANAQTTPPAEHAGPVLAITVAGEANGTIRIALRDDLAPNHVAQIVALAEQGAYDGVVFHRVIDGFMAQTGDVANGNTENGFNLRRAGTGGSDLPDLPAEFSNIPHDRGTLGAARSSNPNSANSQFFINFNDNHFLNKQYTVYGRVISGMEHVDAILRGEPPANPDKMLSVKVAADA